MYTIVRREPCSVPVGGELVSGLGAACSTYWRAGAPDNEAEDVEEDEDEQRNSVVYLLWVGAGFSARPLGLCPFAFPAGSSGITGEGPRNS